MLTLYFAPGSGSMAVRIALPRDDLEKKAQAMSWMSFIASTLHPARQRGPDHARQVYDIAGRRLGGGWALGPYSIADIHLFRLCWRFFNSLQPAAGEFYKPRRALRAYAGTARGAANDRDRIRDTCQGNIIMMASFQTSPKILFKTL